MRVERYRILIDRAPPESGYRSWQWALEWENLDWVETESGRCWTRRGALQKARRRCDYYLLTIDYYEGRIEELHVAAKPDREPYTPKQPSVLGSKLL